MSDISGADNRTNYLHEVLVRLMDSCFPYKTFTSKSSDYPWITEWVKKKIKRRNIEYKKNGKSEAYKRLEKEIVEDFKKAKERLL